MKIDYEFQSFILFCVLVNVIDIFVLEGTCDTVVGVFSSLIIAFWMMSLLRRK